jgi:hypothetical protein
VWIETTRGGLVNIKDATDITLGTVYGKPDAKHAVLAVFGEGNGLGINDRFAATQLFINRRIVELFTYEMPENADKAYRDLISALSISKPFFQAPAYEGSS